MKDYKGRTAQAQKTAEAGHAGPLTIDIDIRWAGLALIRAGAFVADRQRRLTSHTTDVQSRRSVLIAQPGCE